MAGMIRPGCLSGSLAIIWSAMIRKVCCLVLASAAISWCSSVPDVPSGVSAEGLNYISASRWLGVVRTGTYMYLPGGEAVDGRTNAVRCNGKFPGAGIVAHGGMRRDVASYCEQVLRGIDFVAVIYP